MLLKLQAGLTQPEVRPALGQSLVGGLEEMAQEADLPGEGRAQPALPQPRHWDGFPHHTPETRGPVLGADHRPLLPLGGRSLQ